MTIASTGDRFDGIWDGFKGEGRRITKAAAAAAAADGARPAVLGQRCKWYWYKGEIKFHSLPGLRHHSSPLSSLPRFAAVEHYCLLSPDVTLLGGRWS